MFVGGRTGGLDDEDVLAPDTLVDVNRGLTVGKMLHITAAQLTSEDLADVLGERSVGVSCKDTDTRVHRTFPVRMFGYRDSVRTHSRR